MPVTPMNEFCLISDSEVLRVIDFFHVGATNAELPGNGFEQLAGYRQPHPIVVQLSHPPNDARTKPLPVGRGTNDTLVCRPFHPKGPIEARDLELEPAVVDFAKFGCSIRRRWSPARKIPNNQFKQRPALTGFVVALPPLLRQRCQIIATDVAAR
jgi:hypothetical protein